MADDRNDQHLTHGHEEIRWGPETLEQRSKEWQLPPPAIRENAARLVAVGILVVFGVCLTVVLLGGLILAGMKPESAAVLVKDAIVPLLQSTSTFAATVFGPLLAFVLGYYFGREQK